MQLNNSKPVMGIFATLFFFWLIYIVMASDPLSRLNRMCSPAIWTGRGVSAFVGLFSAKDVEPVDQSFNRGFDDCRVWGWNVFYARAYQRMKHEESAAARPATVSAPPPARGAVPPARPGSVPVVPGAQ